MLENETDLRTEQAISDETTRRSQRISNKNQNTSKPIINPTAEPLTTVSDSPAIVSDPVPVERSAAGPDHQDLPEAVRGEETSQERGVGQFIQCTANNFSHFCTH